MARVALLIGSERGFCGDFNETLLAELASTEQDEIIAVGRKLGQRLENCPCKAIPLGGPNVAEDIPETLNRLIPVIAEIQRRHARFELTVLHHHWETNAVLRRQLLPPFRQGRKNRKEHRCPPVLNLRPEMFLLELVDHYLFAVLHEIFYTIADGGKPAASAAHGRRGAASRRALRKAPAKGADLSSGGDHRRDRGDIADGGKSVLMVFGLGFELCSDRRAKSAALSVERTAAVATTCHFSIPRIVESGYYIRWILQYHACSESHC